MGIMDAIRRWQERKKVNSEKFKSLQEEMRMQKMVEQRMKSSNERELERHMEDERQKQIDITLKKIRDKKNKEAWKGTTLDKGTSILKDDRPMLKEKNIFKSQKNMFIDNKNKVPLQNKREGMFFRW